MLFVSAIAVATTIATHAEPAIDSARALVRSATRAANGDSSSTAIVRWRAQLARSPRDRGALLSMVTLATLSGQNAEAERAATALGSARTGDAYLMIAELVRGRAKLAGLDLAGARIAFADALRIARILGDSASASEAFLGQAAVSRRTRGPAATKPLLDSAWRLAPDSLSLARIWCDESFFGAFGFDHVALPLKGAAIAHEADDLRLEGQCRVMAGRGYWYRLRLDSTFQSYTSATTLGRRIHDHQTVGASLRWLGLGFRSFGQFERALASLREGAHESALAGDSTTLAYEELNLGLLANSLRDRALATAYAKSAGGRFDRGGDNEGRASVRYLDGALAVERRDTAAARGAYDAGLEWGRRSGDVSAAHDMYLGVYRLAVLQHKWLVAEQALDSVGSTFRQAGTVGWERTISERRGALAAAKGDAAETVRWYGIWLSGLSASQHNVRYATRLQLALAHLRSGDAKRAENELTSASDELDRYRDSLSDADLKLHATETVENFGAPDDAAERVIASMVAAGRLDVAFNLVERRRGRTLLERLARMQVVSGKKGALPRRALVPTLEAFTGAIPDEKTAVFEYVASSSGSPTSLFVITRSGARGYVLPGADSLAAAMVGFETLVEGGAKAPPSAKSIGDALLARGVADLPRVVTRLLIVPDGPLHRLSFDALVLPDGKRVVERFAVGLLPSAGVAMELWRRDRAARDPWILALGDPRFSGELVSTSGEVDRLSRSAFADVGGLPRLPGSGDEARDVARYAPRAEVRLRDRATEAYVKRTPLDSFSIIHFATHALVDDASASRTSLALAPGDGEDGFLDLNELSTISLTADLVVLSACRTARGPIIGGEGVNGLALPMVQGGARSVVATSWRIGDTRARAFVNKFYSAMARGDVVVDALRAAKLDAIARGEPPRDWAVFTVIGDPLTHVSLRR